QQMIVATERDRVDQAASPGRLPEHPRVRGVTRIPQLGYAVIASAGQGAAVRAERHRINWARIVAEGCGQCRVLGADKAGYDVLWPLGDVLCPLHAVRGQVELGCE